MPRPVKALLVAIAAALALGTGASAEIIRSEDAQGRTITFDVQAQTVDLEWYAALLRAAAHGDEISTVTIRILPESQVARTCGAAAAACYSRGRGTALIVVPAGRDARVASTLLHEYGHHVDQAWSVAGVPELNGTPVWWQLRGMEQLFRSGRVAFDYSRGWDRSIGEIFAEDYAWINLPNQYAISWLDPPDDSLKAAVLQELGGTPPATPPDTPAAAPLVITRNGTIAPRRAQTIPFGLLGPGRRVTFTATVGSATRAGVRARLEVNCEGRRVASLNFGKGRRTRTIDVPNLGPATCAARVVSTTAVRLTYSARLRLAIEL